MYGAVPNEAEAQGIPEGIKLLERGMPNLVAVTMAPRLSIPSYLSLEIKRAQGKKWVLLLQNSSTGFGREILVGSAAACLEEKEKFEEVLKG